MTETPPTTAHIITFTDLVYASLASYGLPLFGQAADRHDWWAVGYLSATAVWLFYDWYANHYFAIEQRLLVKNIPLDAISLAQYAGLLYVSAHTSSWIFLFLAVRALRGIVYNELALWHHPGRTPRDPNRLRSYNYSSGFMLLTYTPLFVIDLNYSIFSVGLRLAVAVGIWFIAYWIALIAEARFDRRMARIGALPQPGPRSGSRILSWLLGAIVVTSALRRSRRHH